eukprot:TRINITY_DN780113_c0_g1_i1.p1 TRINITY_DN780113_c0_g1~~TRINITY_DN780113_c0_g1_i1.p1  ORF type:complete len:189 (-),score=45.45 TRINITY_DN780113_c0_g1_i1:75-641(-)
MNSLDRLGSSAFERMEKVNSELLVLAYGSFVAQLMKDFEDPALVNEQLFSVGHNIGVRIIDEFLAKNPLCDSCKDFKESIEVLTKVGFRMFLGISGQSTNWNVDCTSCTIVVKDNPLDEFVELPKEYDDLWFSNLLCGVIKGALEMINYEIKCSYSKDRLHGAATDEIFVELIQQHEDAAGEEYNDEI